MSRAETPGQGPWWQTAEWCGTETHICPSVRPSVHKKFFRFRSTPWVKKGCHPNHGYNFVNSWSICKNSFTVAKSGKFPTKLTLGYPPHLKYVAALPWKTWKSEICTLHARKTCF